MEENLVRPYKTKKFLSTMKYLSGNIRTLRGLLIRKKDNELKDNQKKVIQDKIDYLVSLQTSIVDKYRALEVKIILADIDTTVKKLTLVSLDKMVTDSMNSISSYSESFLDRIISNNESVDDFIIESKNNKSFKLKKGPDKIGNKKIDPPDSEIEKNIPMKKGGGFLF
jgi:hypothetical protein